MFRTKYTLAELARMLRRSEQSLRRDMKMGRLPSGNSRRRRSMGGSTNYEFTHRDVERNLTPRDLNRLNTYLGKRHVEAEEATAPRGIKRCTTCEMFRPVSKFTYDVNTYDRLSKECLTCQSNRSAPKAVIKNDKTEHRRLSPKKNAEWAGFLKRKK